MAVWPPNSPIDLRAGDDTQLHVPYTAYTFLVAGYVGDVRFGGPTGPGWALACVESTSDLGYRVDGVGRPKFDFHTGPRARVVEELVVAPGRDP